MDRQPTIDRYRSARSDPRLALLEGFHPLKHALRFGAEVLEALSPDPDGVTALARELAPDLESRLGDLLTAIPADLYGDLSPRPPDSGVVALARRPAVRADEVLADPGPAPVVLLEAPSHLGNLGAAVRVAAAAGAAGVLAIGEHDPWHPSALRGSAGLHFALPVVRLGGPEALLPRPDAVGAPALAARGGGGSGSSRPLVALDPEGDALEEVDVPARAVLAFGSERRGLGPELLGAADRRVRIPMRAGVSSLNLATSVAVALYAGRLRAAEREERRG